MKLQLALKTEYFDAIRDGKKLEEYRLVTAYWHRRLCRPGMTFDGLVLTKGYPKAGDPERTLYLPWRGYPIFRVGTHQNAPALKSLSKVDRLTP